MSAVSGELASVLRSWRDRVDPTDVGLARNGPRRAPGLRREEVALLEAHDVLDGDAGQQRHLLATQARRAARPVARQPDVGRVDPVAPGPQHTRQLTAHGVHAAPSAAAVGGMAVTRTTRRSLAAARGATVVP